MNRKMLAKGEQQAILQAARADTQRKAVDLYLAKGMHRAMKRTFRGVMSYPQRKILFDLGKDASAAR